MTTVLLPETDPRGPKAVAIATDSGQWLKCRTLRRLALAPFAVWYVGILAIHVFREVIRDLERRA